MARASKLNTSHQHHCHGWNSIVQPITIAMADPPRHQSFFFFFQQKRLSLKPLLSYLLTWSLHLLIKPLTSMARASKLNTSQQHHCHGQNSMVQPIAATVSHHWGGPIFPRLLSLSLFLFIFIFFCCYSLIYSQNFLFFIAWLFMGLGIWFFFLGLMIWKIRDFDLGLGV